MATPVEIMKIVEFVINNLTRTNLNVMAEKIVVLKIKTEFLLDSITRFIHNRALNNPNYTELYARLCSLVIKDTRLKPVLKSKKTFLTCLVPKCRELLYSYKTDAKPTARGYIVDKRKPINIMLANCKFIGELYKQGILLEKTMRSIIDELITETGNVQVHCLCTIMISIGPNLENIYNMNKIIEYLRVVENQSQSILLKTMINDIKNAHTSIHRDARESIVEERPSPSSETSDKVNTSAPNEIPSVEKIPECIEDTNNVVTPPDEKLWKVYIDVLTNV